MRNSPLITLAAILVLALAACPTTPSTPPPPPNPPSPPSPPAPPPPGPPSPPSPPSPPPPAAPTIVSISPANGATGVTKDANIVVTFSKPMNQAATQAAYQSVSLPAGDVTFSWNASGTELTINPNAGLTYLATTDSAATPKTYSFSLTNTATDLAGNKLVNTNSSFSTLKEVTNTIFSTDALSGMVTSDGFAYINDTSIYVGDRIENTTYRRFVSFDISSFPVALTGKRILNAKLTYNVQSLYRNPFEDLATCTGGVASICTHLIIESVTYGSKLEATDFDVPALRVARAYRISVIQEPTIGSNTVNVLTSLQDDLDNRAARGERSQFRYRYSKLTDGDGQYDGISIRRTTTDRPSLEVVYLYP